MKTPLSQLARDKAIAAAEVLQKTLNELAKDGWDLNTIDSLNGLLILKK